MSANASVTNGCASSSCAWKTLRLVEFAECSFPSELLRLVLAVSGAPHETAAEHVEKDDFYRATVPHLVERYAFGRLPCLEVDGVQLSGANVIARFLADQLGLSGKTAVDAALCASIADAADEMHRGFDSKLKDEAARMAACKEWNFGGYQEWLAKLDKYAAAHVGPSGFLVADQLTWADLALLNFWDVAAAYCADTWSMLEHKYPALHAHAQRVAEEPRVKAFRDKHRPLEFVGHA